GGPGSLSVTRSFPSREVFRHENGPALTSLAAGAASVGAGPKDGPRAPTGQTPQAGLREWQIRRPCQISRWESSTQSDLGMSSATSASTLTGSSLVVPPNRRDRRPTCGSTVM